MITGWHYYWRRYLGWFPVQFCMMCGKWYWGGLPWGGWRAYMKDFCSRDCADEDLRRLG
jgi:hypothetical protein